MTPVLTDLLDLLRDEAASLADQVVPSSAELRPIVGAIVKRLERLETQIVGRLTPAPEAQPRTEPAAANTIQAGPLPVPRPQPIPVQPPEPEPEHDLEPAVLVGDAAAAAELDQARRDLEQAQARVAALTQAG